MLARKERRCVGWDTLVAKQRRSVSTPIPAGPSDLTPEWLSAVLREAGILREGRVVDVAQDVIGEGVGFAGWVARLRVRYDSPRAEAPSTFIAKLPTAIAKNRATVELMQAYEHEIRFYDELRPHVSLETPRRYYAAMDPNPSARLEAPVQRLIERLPMRLLGLLIRPLFWLAGRSRRRYVLLLEDLCDARVGDQVRGCDLPQAKRALEALAVAHASLWNSPRLAALSWLPELDRARRFVHAMFLRARAGFIAAAGDSLYGAERDLVSWLSAHGLELAGHLASPPLTLLHGDYRLDNLFFSDSGLDSAVIAVDWQLVASGRGAWDATYFLTGNLSAPVDAQTEEGLVRCYHSRLIQAGVDRYAFDECLRDCQLSKLFLVYRLIASRGWLDLAGERGADLEDAVVRRLFERLPRPPYDSLWSGTGRGAVD